MSADIRMVPWEVAQRAYDRKHLAIDGAYTSGLIADAGYREAMGELMEEEGAVAIARANLILRGYWDHRPKRDR